MSRSVASERGPREVNDGDLSLIGECPVSQQTVNVDDGAWMPKLIGACVDRHMSHKAASITMGLNKSQATREMEGDGHLSAKRVGLLPREVLLDFADGIRAKFGVVDSAARKRAAAEELIRCVGRLVAVEMGE